MPQPKPRWNPAAARQKLREAIELLTSLGFTGKQTNTTAGYVLLALLDLKPDAQWADASAPLRGITPIIDFVAIAYRVRYAPNTRETVRDEAVKYFVEAGLLIRNPDNPKRPTNSGNTVYQVEPTALALIRSFGTSAWQTNLTEYLSGRSLIRGEIERARAMGR